jgi:hypothetical protein
MPLLAILDESAHGTLDESLKTLYVQNAENKQFYLDVAPDEAGKLAFNLQKEKDLLKTNNAELLKQKGEANTKLKTFESLGKTADEIKAALEANRPEEVTKMVSDYEAKIKSLEDSYKDSLTKETELRTKAQANLEKTVVETTIAKLRADHDLNDTADFVLQNFIKPVRNEETGEISTVIYENGNPALVAGQPKTTEQLLNGWKEEKKFLSIFNAGVGGGTGGTNRQTSVSGSKVIKRVDWEQRSAKGEDFTKFFTEGGTVID